MTKAELRKAYLSRRMALTSYGAAQKSAQIAQALLSSHHYLHAGAFSLYSSMRGEVSTEAIFLKARDEGRVVAFPRVADHTLEFLRVDDLNDLHPGNFGIPEPRGSSSVPLTSLDMLIVPGVAFDTHGNRLGYGKGYFDTILRQAQRPVALGLAFECQIYDGILPVESGDACVDLVVTEERIIGRIHPGTANPPMV